MPDSLARVRIVDDDPDMLKSWEFLLSSAGYLVSAYGSAKEFLDNDDPSIPGCLVLDIRMPEISGLELQEILNEERNPLPIIFCSAHASIDMCVSALKHGAIDFMEKPVDTDRLILAIENACALNRKNSDKVRDRRKILEKFNTLTTREQEVAFALADGISNREAGQKLGITEKTVQIHRGSLCRKMSIRSQVEIANLVKIVLEER